MRQWNKETINEQLKLHKKQNKDERYNYFSREFNSLWYCWELEKYTINLQNQLQQKENIIKEVREEVRIYEEQSNDGTTNELDNYVFVQRLKKVLDKENKQ